MEFRHVDREKCMGCGLCFSVCRFDAVRMSRDEYGFIPIYDMDACVECGECVDMCPGHNILDYPGHFGEIKRCLISTASDEQMRYTASSGGACRAVLAALLEKGIVDRVIVTRATDDPYTPETIVTGNAIDLMPDNLNSIYSPTSPLSTIKHLDDDLAYAFVGLPCHIAGLALCPNDIRRKIYMTIGIFCSHMPSFKFVDAFIRDRSSNGPVKGVRFRGRGWPGQSVAIHENGRETETGFIDMWYTYNHERAYQLSRCGMCSYYSAEFADISIGDPWHLFGKDDIGSSLVLVRTDRGEEALKAADRWLNIAEVPRIEDAMDFHVQHSVIKQENKARWANEKHHGR